MSKIFSSLIDALKEAQTWLLVAICSAGFTVWRIDWGAAMVSKIGLVFFVFAVTGLAWRFFVWCRVLSKKKSFTKTDEIMRIANECRSMKFKLRNDKRSIIDRRDPELAPNLRTLYARLSKLDVRTPKDPPLSGHWSVEEHIDFLIAVTPFLEQRQIDGARSASKEVQ